MKIVIPESQTWGGGGWGDRDKNFLLIHTCNIPAIFPVILVPMITDVKVALLLP